METPPAALAQGLDSERIGSVVKLLISLVFEIRFFLPWINGCLNPSRHDEINSNFLIFGLFSGFGPTGNRCCGRG